MLRALFRPPQSTRVQRVVAPLLDASEEVLREKAAAVLGKVRCPVQSSPAHSPASRNLELFVVLPALFLPSGYSRR